MVIRFLLAFAAALHRIATKLRIAAIESETLAGYAATCAAHHRRYKAQEALTQITQAVDELRAKANAAESESNRRASFNAYTIDALKHAAL